MQALTSAPGEVSGHSLHAADCTDVSFVTSSAWVEASDITGASTVGALRQVPTILAETWSSPLGCGLQARCRGPPCTPCLRKLSLHALFAHAVRRFWWLVLPKGCLNLPRLLLATPRHTSAPLTRKSCRLLAGLAALPLGFPGSRNPPVYLGRAPSHGSYCHCHCLFRHPLSAHQFCWQSCLVFSFKTKLYQKFWSKCKCTAHLPLNRI